MKQEELTKMSLDELKSKEKTLKSSMAILGGMIIVLLITGVFLTIKQGFGVFTVLPIVFLPIFTMNIGNLKKIQSEIALRNS